ARPGTPIAVDGSVLVTAAVGGLAANLAGSLLLSRADRTSLNIRGAFLHIVTDLAAFIGTALAGVLVLAAGWNRADPIASLCVAGLMFWSAASLLRESTLIFLERSPAGLDPNEGGRALLAGGRRPRGPRPRLRAG